MEKIPSELIKRKIFMENNRVNPEFMELFVCKTGTISKQVYYYTKSTMCNCGCLNLDLLHQNARLTTTHRQLNQLPSSIMIIDTLGMCELSICKFSDCWHESKSGCAIISAIEKEKLSSNRWHSYLNFKKETKFLETKFAFLGVNGIGRNPSLDTAKI